MISEVAERVPDRIATLVYLAALLLPAGETISGFASRHPGGPDAAIRIADGARLILHPDLAPQFFYIRYSDEDIAFARARLSAEPAASMRSPVRISEERFGGVPRAYIEATEDRAIPIELQRAMQVGQPCGHRATLASDHSPSFSMAAELTQELLRLSR